jgi:Tfp pilus assembly protein PilF
MNHLHFRRLASVFSVLLLVLLPSLAPCAESAKEQMEFGVKAAKKGLWREALFRWEKALKLDPKNARLINNLAVAYEIAGEFEKADGLYQQALRIDPENRDIKQNHELFTSYYKQIRARREGQPAAPPPPPPEPDEASPPPDDATLRR